MSDRIWIAPIGTLLQFNELHLLPQELSPSAGGTGRATLFGEAAVSLWLQPESGHLPCGSLVSVCLTMRPRGCSSGAAWSSHSSVRILGIMEQVGLRLKIPGCGSSSLAVSTF